MTSAKAAAPPEKPAEGAKPTTTVAQASPPEDKLGSEVFDYIFDPNAADRFARNLAIQRQQQSQYDQFLFPQDTYVPESGMQNYRQEDAAAYLRRLQRRANQSGAMAAEGVMWPGE